MDQTTDNRIRIPLIEYFEECRTLLRASVRALVAMRLLDLYMRELPGRSRVLINPATYELSLSDTEETLWPASAFEVPEGSSWHRQGYIAAVYVSLIITGTHPYKGRRYYESAILDDTLLRRHFVEHPEYVLASNSMAANAPLSYTQPHVGQLFNSLPQEWRAVLKEVFGSTGKVWFPADEDLPTSVQTLREQLWALYSMISTDESVSIQVEGCPLILSEGKQIAFPSTLEVIGKCEVKKSSRTGSSLLMVQNKSGVPWKRVVIGDVKFQCERESDVKPGEFLTLKPGINIEKDEFDGITITVKPGIKTESINNQ